MKFLFEILWKWGNWFCFFGFWRVEWLGVVWRGSREILKFDAPAESIIIEGETTARNVDALIDLIMSSGAGMLAVLVWLGFAPARVTWCLPLSGRKKDDSSAVFLRLSSNETWRCHVVSAGEHSICSRQNMRFHRCQILIRAARFLACYNSAIHYSRSSFTSSPTRWNIYCSF